MDGEALVWCVAELHDPTSLVVVMVMMMMMVMVMTMVMMMMMMMVVMCARVRHQPVT